MNAGAPRSGPRLSFAALAFAVAGSAAVVLGLTALLVAVLDVSPLIRALVVVVGLVLAVAAMAFASRRVTERMIKGDEVETGTHPDDGHTGATH